LCPTRTLNIGQVAYPLAVQAVTLPGFQVRLALVDVPTMDF